MNQNPFPRRDQNPELYTSLLPFCRLQQGQIWMDPQGKHRVGCLDAADPQAVRDLSGEHRATLAIHDPPYNLVVFEERSVEEYIRWSQKWIENTIEHLAPDASLYLWLGADQKDNFQPLPEFMLLLRQFKSLRPASFITMRNQRGYGTPKNLMAVRQELLYYVQGNPFFQVQYTDIPKILRGYYKEVKGLRTENLQRGKANTIRPGNVWVDVQQVFYRMEENVSGCYAQKPLKAIERILNASSRQGDLVLDFFSHSGTTLLASEIFERKCFTIDQDPVFCEITIRRLEHYRNSGKRGWQNGNPFETELPHYKSQKTDDSASEESV